MSTDSKWGAYGIFEEKKGLDGQFYVMLQMYIDSPILNPERISGKQLWYTTESGYNYNHPYATAKRNAEILCEALNCFNDSGKTPKELAEMVSTYESKFVQISECLKGFTNGSICIAKDLSDNPLGKGFPQINPLYSENKALAERVKELEKELDQYRSAVHRANFG